MTWAPAPTADEIRARDQERFLADPIFTEPMSDAETPLVVTALKAGRSADDIALALVRLHRARLPEPEDLAEDTGRRGTPNAVAFRGGEREGRLQSREGQGGGRPWEKREPREHGRGAGEERGARPPRARREDNREMTWFTAQHRPRAQR